MTNNRLLTFTLAAAFAVGFAPMHDARAAKGLGNWPKVIKNSDAKIVVYQPQLESFGDAHIQARSAVSVTPPKAKEPIFGAVWFVARCSVDRESRIVKLEGTKVTDAKFPNAKAEQVAWLKGVLEEEIPNWGSELSYDELVAGLEVVEKEQAASERIGTKPPEIIYRTEPSVLVTIDGDPIIRDVAGTDLRAVLNTPFFIVQDSRSKRWYLTGSEHWYSSDDVMGPWKAMRDLPPRSVADFADQVVSKAPVDPDQPKQKEKPVVPNLYVRTKPAEMIQTDGEPKYEAVKGTGLLYVDNTDDVIMMEIATQRYFVLVSGRWYATKSLSDGPWQFVPGEELPADFQNIPANSELGGIRASIPGTQEAKEAVLENSIPTTAEVDRKTATVTVTYDGQPKFEPIEGTSMSYAVNTDKSVLLIGGKYYCCDQAVWFESNDPMGPWTVSTVVPADVKSIPPESPVYNVKYVDIYDSTPEVVYVGYTPAYCGSYVYGGCVVYGTGYYYHPWYGAYYYPRPVTYGFGVHYSPYAGWGFSFGMSYGWFNMSIGWYGGGGYWGPGGYAAGYHHGYRHGYAAGYHRGQNAGARPTPRANNLYGSRGGSGVRPAGRPSTQPAQRPGTAGARPSTQPNNMYADRNGNVYQKSGNNYQQRGSGAQTRPNTNDLNRQYEARERSTQRTQNYNRSYSRPSGGRAGGGGRRR